MRIESTVIGIEIDDASEIADKIVI